MSLLTMFSAPKAFTDPRIALIQTNAIASWARLEDVDVLLLGGDEGIAEAARRCGVENVRDIGTNESGTPLVSSMVRTARERSSSPLLCIINADMIVMRDFVWAARQALSLVERFVLLGRRWDLRVERQLEFVDGWEQNLREAVSREGALHRPAGSDFFVFPRHCYDDIPDFAVGRAGWDNWMIYKARRMGWAVIDATTSITVVHQNHDYAHLPGGAPHYAVPESHENVRLAGGDAAVRYTVLDATHVLKDGRLCIPDMSRGRVLRQIELALRAALFFLPATKIEELSRPRRWKKRILRILGRK